MSGYSDIWHRTEDGLRIHARDYGPRHPSLAVICLPGLTRNAADFEALCEHFAGIYRMLAVEQRGRGHSDYDADSSHYDLARYVRDTFGVLDALGLQRVALVGTSMGGLMAMLMAAQQPARVRSIALNDIGPVVEAEGLERIQGYAGRTPAVDDWAAAAAQTRASQAIAFPDYTERDWLEFAARLYREREDGTLEPAYDPRIAEPMAASTEAAAPPNLWSVFDALPDIPLLVFRGARSDILSAATAEAMQQRKSLVERVEVPRVGHAPTLNEPVCVEALQAFLGRLSA